MSKVQEQAKSIIQEFEDAGSPLTLQGSFVMSSGNAPEPLQQKLIFASAAIRNEIGKQLREKETIG